MRMINRAVDRPRGSEDKEIGAMIGAIFGSAAVQHPDFWYEAVQTSETPQKAVPLFQAKWYLLLRTVKNFFLESFLE
jgi:hypothetical protein